jgi:hypothetical protein
VPQAFLHAKISLLVWANHVRLIVASANLTEDGYRRNQEVFGVLDYREGGDAPPEVLRETLPFLRETLRACEPRASQPSEAVGRCHELLAHVERLLSQWNLSDRNSSRAALRIVPILTGPGKRSVIDQLEALWPAGTRAKGAHILSPFFDPPAATNLPATEIWRLLRKRGEPDVHYYVTVERSVVGEPALVRAPEALRRCLPADRPTATVGYQELQLDAQRPLHAKGIYLHDDRWIVYCLGSSNFTRAGLGLQGPANLEANLAYLADCDADPALRQSLDQAFPNATPLDLEAETVQWQALPNEDEAAEAEVAQLPPACGAATYDLDDQGRAVLRLSIAAAMDAGWKVLSEDETLIVNEGAWLASQRPAELIVPWDADRPPSGLWLQWEGRSARAWWPVNIARLSVLPPVDELRDLPLEMLINILTSARPLHRVLADHLKRRRSSSANGAETKLDPHQRVDTSQFLLQRTRRVSAALKALADRLARPLPTEESLQWRLHGPVGVEAVAKAILKDALANDCGESQVFLIAELALELSQVRPQTAPGALPAKRVKEEIAKLIGQLGQRYASATVALPDNLSRYVADAFAKAAP